MKEPLSLIWTFLLSRTRVTLLFTLMAFIWGLFAYNNIVRESSPEIEIPVGIVSTFWPGASAVDVEKLVTEKIEQEVKGLENVEEYTSVSRDGFSVVSVEFETGTDMTENRQKLREALDLAELKLPATLPDEPKLEIASASNLPILTLGLSGDFPLTDLKRFAELLQDELETVSGVKEVLVSGLPEEKFHIFVDPLRLQAFGLSVEDVVNSIQSAHRDLPLGSIFSDGEKISLRVAGEIETVEDFLSLPLKSLQDRSITLAEIATIRREFAERDVETYFSAGKNFQPSLTLDVIKSEAKTNVTKAVARALEIVESYQAQGLVPASLELDVIYNGATDIQKDLDRLLISGSQTLILITIILLFALGWREAVLAFFAIPLSALISVGTLYALGETFNFLSLFALILSIGLLVDNAIIMVEGISEAIHYQKLSPKKAALHAIRTFRWPIITGTCTTVFAFLPMMILITGTSGQFIRVIPITVTVVLLASLVVSVFFMPVFGYLFFTAVPPKIHGESKILLKLHAWYRPFMERVLGTWWKSVGALVIAGIILVASVSLVVRGKIPVEIFPGSDENFFTARIELPKGTKLQETKKYIPAVSEALVPFFDENGIGDGAFKSMVMSVGKPSNFDPSVLRGAGGTSEPEIIGITLNLVDKPLRDLTSKEALTLVEERLKEAMPPFAEITMGELEGGPPSGSNPIEIRLVSEDLEHLENVTDILLADMDALTLESGVGLKNLTDDRGEILPQITWKINRQNMERYGLRLSSVSQTLRSSVEGIRIIQISEGEDEVDVELRLDFEGNTIWTDPDNLSILEAIPLKIPSGNYISLKDIADFQIGPSRSIVRHRDGKRVVTVGADIDGKAAPSEFVAALDASIEKLPRRPGDSFEIGGDNEESNRLISEMVQAMVFAMFLILIVLVMQFNSFIQALVILAAVPLSLTAVFIGFWLSGTPISFPTMIGIVSLAGIIVNDDIVLIDRINHHSKKEDDPELNDQQNYIKALIEGCVTRMQPIFLTSITTVIGMLPLALSDPVWEGLGFAVIYGMSLSTVLTLFLTPCILITFDRFFKLFTRFKRS